MTKQNRFFGAFGMVKVWLLLAFLSCVGNLFFILTDSESIVVPVKPLANSKFYDSSFYKKENTTIQFTGNLVLEQPTLYERIMLPSDGFGGDFFNSLILFIIVGILLFYFNNLLDLATLKKEISKPLQIIGILLICYHFFEGLQIVQANNIIKQKTEGMFIHSHYKNFSIISNLWIGILLLFFVRVYKKAFSLQQEQDLTV